MSNPTIPYKIYLNETEMPKAWYNLRADMKVKPAPLLNPGTHEPMKAEELAGVFYEELIKQELDDTTPFFEIPEPIRNFYKMYRPSPFRLTKPNSRVSRALLLKPVPVSGAQLFPWPAPTLVWTARSIL